MADFIGHVPNVICLLWSEREPLDQAVPRSAEVDEDDAEDWMEGLGEVVWVGTVIASAEKQSQATGEIIILRKYGIASRRLATATKRSAEIDEDDAEDRWKRVGQVVWMISS